MTLADSYLCLYKAVPESHIFRQLLSVTSQYIRANYMIEDSPTDSKY